MTNDGLRDVASMKEFGARCDGVTDDTQAIIKALEAVCGGIGRGSSWPGRGTVVIPTGTCMITPNQTAISTFQVYSNCTIQGSGKNSILKVVNNAGNYNALFGGSGSDTLSNITFRDFRIDQNAAGQLSTNGCTANCHVSRNCPNGCTDLSTISGCKNVSGLCYQVVIGLSQVSGLTISNMVFADATGGWVVNVQNSTANLPIRGNISNNEVSFRSVRTTDMPGSGASVCTASTDSSRCTSSYQSATPWIGLCPDGTVATQDACQFIYDQSAFYFEGEDVSITENVMIANPATPPAWRPNTAYSNGAIVSNVQTSNGATNFYRLAVPFWKTGASYTSGQIVATGGVNQFNQGICMSAGSTATSGATQPICTGVPIGNCNASDGTITWTYTSTCGTSAPSGPGPQGVGNGIVDGTLTWNYAPNAFDRGTTATSAFEIHGGRYSIKNNVVKNYGVLLNAVASTFSSPEITPQNWVVSGNTATCSGNINLATLSEPANMAAPRSVRNVNISGNTINFCNADHQNYHETGNGVVAWLAAASNCDTSGDSYYDNIIISGNTITFQKPDDKNYLLFQLNAAVALGAHNSAGSFGIGFCPSRSSWQNIVIQGNTIQNSPQTGIFLDICKTIISNTAVGSAAAMMSRATNGTVTVTTPNPTAWAASTGYAVGNFVTNDSNPLKLYEVRACTGGCVSAASGGPTGTRKSIVDNQVTWTYVAPSDGRVSSGACWIPSTPGHLFSPGQTIYVTPGEANFPAGYKVITSIGSELPSTTFTYQEAAGVAATNRKLQNFQSVGSRIKITDNVIVDSGHSNIGTLGGAGAGAKRAAVQLVDGPYSDVEISRNKITDTSNTATLNGLQGLDFQTVTGSRRIRLAKNAFTTVGTGTLAAPNGPLNGVVDTGEFLDVHEVSLDAVTYTPDPTRYSRHLLTLTSRGTTTIANPSPYGITGQKLEITVRNRSGGKLNLRWGSAYKQAFRTPKNNTSATIVFTYDGTKWIQVGFTSCAVAGC